jgi:hypothetical protein
MTTYTRICVKDYAVEKSGEVATVKRGQEYITSKPDADGYVTVFTRYWFSVPVSHFGGEQLFTP